MNQFYYLLVAMSKNIPTSCWNNDPTAPWNDITIKYKYTITIVLDDVEFTSKMIVDSCTFSHFDIKTEDDWMFIENNLYLIIEDSLSKEISELPYQVKLINFSY